MYYGRLSFFFRASPTRRICVLAGNLCILAKYEICSRDLAFSIIFVRVVYSLASKCGDFGNLYVIFIFYVHKKF